MLMWFFPREDHTSRDARDPEAISSMYVQISSLFSMVEEFESENYRKQGRD